MISISSEMKQISTFLLLCLHLVFSALLSISITLTLRYVTRGSKCFLSSDPFS